MNFRAFRQQPFPSTLTPPREGGASAFGAHAGAKTVLVFPGALRALECAFHGFVCRRGATLGTFLFLSTVACNLDILLLLILVLVIDWRQSSSTSTSTSTSKSKSKSKSTREAHPHCEHFHFVE